MFYSTEKRDENVGCVSNWSANEFTIIRVECHLHHMQTDYINTRQNVLIRKIARHWKWHSTHSMDFTIIPLKWKYDFFCSWFSWVHLFYPVYLLIALYGFSLHCDLDRREEFECNRPENIIPHAPSYKCDISEEVRRKKNSEKRPNVFLVLSVSEWYPKTPKQVGSTNWAGFIGRGHTWKHDFITWFGWHNIQKLFVIFMVRHIKAI